MNPFKDLPLESDLRQLVATDEGAALIRRFGSLTRESGTPDEHAAADYIVGRLRALGIPVTAHRPDLFLSIPERSELAVQPDGGRPEAIRSRPPSFSLSTNGGEVTGELCYVPSKFAGGTGSLFDTPIAAANELASDPVAGRIVLTEGYSMPGTVHAFERRGAIAQIYIHPGREIHEGICTTIWGAPTHETVGRKPRTPVVCVNNTDGRRLADLASNGGARITMQTWLREGWAPCVVAVADIRGTEDPDEFLLVHGHYDSWYVGIGDNATGDAALLELARVLHANRGRLKRSVRVAWWPGHSTGRYAGSTWYADTFADEIDEWCIAHLNIDSPGCVGATAYEEVMWMAEAASLCTTAIGDALGARATGMRPLRAGDYSFNQIGPSAFYMLLSNIPIAERQQRGLYAVGGNGGSTTWHTPNDLPGVEDLDILRRDLQVYVTTIARVLNAPIYPFDYGAAIDEMSAAVTQYANRAGREVDLGPVVEDLSRLRGAWTSWRTEAASRADRSAAERRAVNASLRRLARILVPLNYARGERFDHDAAVKFGVVPRLEAAERLASARDDEKPFIKTSLIRERNKVRAMVRQAARELATVGAAAAVALMVMLACSLPAHAQNRTATEKTKTLEPTPDTVAYGYYDAAAKPVLTIKPGESIRIHTLLTSTPKRLEDAGVAAADVEPALREIVDTVKDKGPGGHILNGPIYIEGAEPGDVLEVHIDKIDLAIPYSYNAFSTRSGFLPQDFTDGKMKIIPLDRRRMTAKFADGIEIPLRPFFGSMGIAPPPSAGRVSSAPTGKHAGNLDNKDLVAGSTLYIPVNVPGALFEVGDGHAGQGDGEVDITALETSLIGTFHFALRKGKHLTWPRAETPTHFITMGIDDDLTEATRIATREMIDFLSTEKGLSREDAYMLTSVAGALAITQLVDGPKGVHAKISKAIFKQAKSAPPTRNGRSTKGPRRGTGSAR